MKTAALPTLLVLLVFLFAPLIPAVAAPASAEPGNSTPQTTTEPPGTPATQPAPAPTASTESTGFVPLAPIPGLTDVGSNITSSTLAGFLNNLYLYLIGAAATLAVIMIIWGGLEISTQDSISKQGAGRQKIQQAILGLVLVLSPVLVFSIINPSILNLSLALPALDTKTSRTPSSSVKGPTACANATYTGSGGPAASPLNADKFQVFSKGSPLPAADANYEWKEINLAGCTCSDVTGSVCYARYPKNVSAVIITKCPEGDPAQCSRQAVQDCQEKHGAVSYKCVNTLDGKTIVGDPNSQKPYCTATNIYSLVCTPPAQ